MKDRIWNLERFGDSLAAIDEQGQITYAELKSEGGGLVAAFLRDEQADFTQSAAGRTDPRGRCLVLQLCRNTIGSLLGYTAFVNNGVVPLLLSESTNRDLLDTLIKTYRPAYIWLSSELADAFDFPSVYEARGFSLLKTDGKQYPIFEDLALLMTTSGSTGSPKLVRQSYKNILANAKSIAQYLELDASERPITTLPMSYVYGLSVINSHLSVGATMIMTTRGYMERDFWDMFKAHGATSVAGVPYNYEMLKKLRFLRMDLPSLRYMTQAGGKLSAELHKEYAEYAERSGKRFYVMYGQSEATARMSYLPPERSLEKYGSMGIAIPGGQFSLIDDVGRTITEPNTVGELVYKGENVTLGYAERGEDLIKGDENGGTLMTGDMARRDADGYYYIVGRKKRFLKIFGNRVALDECERMLKARFDSDFACVGVDDRMTIYTDGGTNGRTEQANEHAETIRRFIAEKTGLNISAFAVKIAEIPKNEAGKTLYGELEKVRNDE